MKKLHMLSIVFLMLLLPACSLGEKHDKGEKHMNDKAEMHDSMDDDMHDEDDEDHDEEDHMMGEESISFNGKSSLVDHPGTFEKFTVQVNNDGDDFEDSRIAVSIDITSVKTDSRGLDRHLQKEDFFDTANHPNATFESTSITKKGDDQYAITGDLTIKGITKQVTFNANVDDGWISFAYDLPRGEFDVGSDSYGDKLLADKIPVMVQVKI